MHESAPDNFTPAPKSAGLEQLLDTISMATYGRSRTESILESVCVSCGRDVTLPDFRDQASHDEYELSALCQKCQDETFDTPE